VGKRSKIGGHAVHRSAEQGRALVKQWRQSGLSVSEFCRRQAVGAHVLRYWLLRDAKPGATAATGDAFYVVSAPSAESAEIAQVSMGGRGRAGGAVIVVLPAATSEQLVPLLAHCRANWGVHESGGRSAEGRRLVCCEWNNDVPRCGSSERTTFLRGELVSFKFLRQPCHDIDRQASARPGDRPAPRTVLESPHRGMSK